MLTRGPAGNSQSVFVHRYDVNDLSAMPFGLVLTIWSLSALYAAFSSSLHPTELLAHHVPSDATWILGIHLLHAIFHPTVGAST
jgi:hypothetical protein